MDLNNTIEKMDLKDIQGTLHPTAPTYIFLSSAYGTISRTDQINNRRKTGKFTNTW